MKNLLTGLFPKTAADVVPPPPTGAATPQLSEALMDDEAGEKFKPDLELLGDDQAGGKIQEAAQKEIRSAAELSLKRLQVLQQGRCPQCGASLTQTTFVSVCDACGWSSYSMPRSGGVRVHTAHGDPVEGERCIVVKDGVVLVVRDEAVFARIPAKSVEWIEYVWAEGELEERRRAVNERLTLSCGWCGKETNSTVEGFHLVQAAFGATQERYCFCSDECYEAFKSMYPSRVDRNCYERSCEGCDLCIKRYSDENKGLRTLAKDLISIHK